MLAIGVQRRRLRVWLAAWSLAILLGACAAPAPRPSGDAGFALAGRLSVRYRDATSGKSEQLYGNFDWLDRDDHVDLMLTNPLGQTVARIESDARLTTLAQANGETRSGATPEVLTEQVLGWILPIRGLRYWLRGAASAGTAAVEKDSLGRTVAIRENGWVISYLYKDDSGRADRIDLDFADHDILLRLIPTR